PGSNPPPSSAALCTAPRYPEKECLTVILRRPPISASTRVFDALWAGLEGCTAPLLQHLGRRPSRLGAARRAPQGDGVREAVPPSIRQLHAGQHEARDIDRALDVAELLQCLEQRAQLAPRDLAAHLEELV